ncbi:hypothetical protein FLONG3_6463 [Fusarium longipes]|uniref:Zn(2)-C6 fungal-type domain-containing protein n=1 Tax=Fusarium longipes TaxID=694270 RepID=A0A395SM15_9HYPO|nr:hypothetical protein FLONG3_6463 [Fusarium longipes]
MDANNQERIKDTPAVLEHPRACIADLLCSSSLPSQAQLLSTAGMVNPGKPSRGCTTCKKRKIKCDQSTPACTQCKTAGWNCPGPSNPVAIFRNKTATDIARRNGVEIGALTSASGSENVREPDTWKRPVSPPVRDRATTFFIRHHEYLPVLIRNQPAFGLFSTIVAAAGFAALSLAGNVSEWRCEAFRLYQTAVRQLQSALRDPIQRVSDETLGAVLLMGTFETIAFADTGSMKAFSQHIIAAAQCIEMRGPRQFQTTVGLKLFMQLRRTMLQEPFPFGVSKWSKWAEPYQTEAFLPVNQLSQINEALASTRAELKYKGITDPDVVCQRLLPLDKMMEEWAQTLPASWEYKSYRSIGPNGVPSSTYNLQYDIYTDPWIACVWNCYRNARLLIHESIIVAVLKHGTQEQKDSLQSSFRMLKVMADGICHSTAYHLGHRHDDSRITSYTESWRSGISPAPGGFLLLWPLFFAAIQRTSSAEQRVWIAIIIRQIGKQLGLRVALAMADLLEKEMKDIAFSNEDTFLLGEWHPN